MNFPTQTINRINKNCTFQQITFINITIGIIIGLCRTSFQSVLDPAEWIAGIVRYPAHHPFAEYFNSSSNFQTYLAAGFLTVGFDELFISAFYCCATCVLYLLFWQNTSYYFTRSRLFAFIIPQLLLQSGFLLIGLHYELVIPPGQVTFGPFAIILASWCLSLLLIGKARWTIILIGLMPLIHPFIGIYFIMTLSLSILLTRAFPHKYNNLFSLIILGLVSSLIMIVLRGTDSYVSSAAFTQFLQYNISKHRVTLSAGLDLNILLAGLGILALVLWQSRRNNPFTQAFLFTISLLVVSALTLSYINALPLTSINNMLRQIYNSIPLRNANILYLIIFPIALSLFSKPTQLFFLYCLFALTLRYYISLYMNIPLEGSLEGSPFATDVYQSYYLIILAMFLLCLMIEKVLKYRPHLSTNLTFTLNSVLLISTLLLSAIFSITYASQFFKRMSYYKNDTVLYAVSKHSHGLLLIAGAENIDRVFTQSRSRRALIYDIQIPAALPYLGVEPISVIDEVKEIYGLNLVDINRKNHINLPCDGLACSEIKNIFSIRNSASWKSLAIKYHFCDILVPHDWTLQIKLIASSSLWNLYQVNQC